MKNSGNLAWWVGSVCGAALLAPSAHADAVKVDVLANIAHWTGQQKIGTITMDTGRKGDARSVDANFEFAGTWGDLDKFYDFDWVNVVRDMSKGMKDALFPRGAPAIDPQSGDVSGAAEDDYPYYYNWEKEWKPAKFDGETIHSEGKFSRFLDTPKSPDKEDFLKFSVLLTVRDDGKITKGGKDTFCILSGLDWEFVGGDMAASTIGKERTIDDAFMKDFVVKALGEDHKDAFDTWTASFGCTLVPTPGSAALALMGIGAAWRRSRART